MSPEDLAKDRRRRNCGLKDSDDCDNDCEWSKGKKICVPKDSASEANSKFMNGSKFLTFRSNKKPAFSFRIPINEETLIGKYSGAIRFSPATGKLHLCYGPLADAMAVRPVLAMLVKPKLSENLWSWYTSSGRTLQKKRVRETDGKGTHTDIYALPGVLPALVGRGGLPRAVHRGQGRKGRGGGP